MYVLALVFALALQPVVNNGKATVTTHPASQQPAHSPTPVDVERITPPSADQDQTKANEHQGNSSDARYAVEIKQQPAPEDTPLFKWYLLATAFGVSVNAFIWFAILRQTKLNLHQLRTNIITAKAAIRSARAAKASAKAAQDTVQSLEKQFPHLEQSANAAKMSADVLVNSERAWLLVDVERAPGSASLLTGTNAENIPYTAILVDVIVKNQGRSPAWIIQHFQFFEILDSIPPAPDFEKNIRDGDIYSQPVAVNGEYKMRCDLVAIGRKEDNSNSDSIIYGIIRYRDIFSKIRYTTYAYYVDIAGRIYRMTDHPKYNEST
jgi:hypothetical protein